MCIEIRWWFIVRFWTREITNSKFSTELTWRSQRDRDRFRNLRFSVYRSFIFFMNGSGRSTPSFSSISEPLFPEFPFLIFGETDHGADQTCDDHNATDHQHSDKRRVAERANAIGIGTHCRLVHLRFAANHSWRSSGGMATVFESVISSCDGIEYQQHGQEVGWHGVTSKLHDNAKCVTSKC